MGDVTTTMAGPAKADPGVRAWCGIGLGPGPGPAPRPHQLIGTAVAVGILSAVTVWGRAVSDPSGNPPALDMVVAVVACLSSPVLFWRPISGTLAFSLLAALSPAATPVAALGALHVAQRHRLRIAIAVASAGVAAHAVLGLLRPNGGISYGWWLLLIAAAYGALVGWGAVARSRRALLASLSERARRAEAERDRRVAEAQAAERTRIAREMHDVLAHRLTLLATYAGALEYRPDAPPERLAQAAGVVRDGAHRALEDLREVIGVLRHAEAGEDAWKVPAWADLGELVRETRETGTRVTLRDTVDDPDALPGMAARTAFRVVQEGLTNARKHAAGHPVEVSLCGRCGDELMIDVRNPLPTNGSADGDGDAGRSVAPGSGTGLIGLGERVSLAGGRLDHGAAGGEFRLRAWLPWPA